MCIYAHEVDDGDVLPIPPAAMTASDLLGFEVASDLVCEFFGAHTGEQWRASVDLDLLIWRGDSGGDDDGIRLECRHLGGDVGRFALHHRRGDTPITQHPLQLVGHLDGGCDAGAAADQNLLVDHQCLFLRGCRTHFVGHFGVRHEGGGDALIFAHCASMIVHGQAVS